MKRILYILAALFTLDVLAYGQGTAPLTVQEIDGSPKKTGITRILVSNGSLVISGNTATITTGAGSGSPGGGNTTVQYNNGGVFGGISTFTSNGTYLTLNTTDSQALKIGANGQVNPAFWVDPSTASSATGVQIKSSAAGGGALITAISSGTDENLVLAGKGAGTVQLTSALSGTTATFSGAITVASCTGCGGSSGITIGTTTITSGTNTRVLYNNSGVVGEYTITGTGNVAMSASPTFTGTVAAAAATFSGAITQTSASATAFESGPNGGTNPVFRLVNSTASQADGVSVTGLAAGSGTTFTALSSGSNSGLNFTGKGTGGFVFTSGVTTGTGATAGLQGVFNSLTTGNGVDISSTSATSGNLVSIASTSTAAASSTLTGLKIAMSGANGTTAQTVTGASISVTNTNATSGTNIALTATASGATTANYAAVLTGNVALSGTTSSFPMLKRSGTKIQSRLADDSGFAGIEGGELGLYDNSANRVILLNGVNFGFIDTISSGRIGFSSSSTNPTSVDLTLRRANTANLALGATDAASPVAQTISVQNVVAGTSNTAGANWTFTGSRGTGTGAGGDIIFQTAPAGTTGTSQNALASAFTVSNTGAVQLKSVTFANLPTVANAYLIYCSDCTLASPCASGGTGALAKGINGAWVCN